MNDRVKDPVCLMEIGRDQAIEATYFEGERLYFCSPGCYGAFLDTPHRYRGWASDRSAERVAWFLHPRHRAAVVGVSAH